MNKTGIRFDLLAKLHAIIDGIPADRFKLKYIASNSEDDYKLCDVPTHCGTVGCALGWAGMHPDFRKLGFKTTPQGSINSKRGDTCYLAASDLFKITPSQAVNLFKPSNEFDRAFYDVKPGDDKGLFKARVRAFFIDHGQPVREQPWAKAQR